MSALPGGGGQGRLDPQTANVGFDYRDLTGGGCVGRVYYWYDPSGELPSVDDWDLRPQHPEIDDRTWQQLFYDAFDRGETESTAEYLQTLELTGNPVHDEPLQLVALEVWLDS